MPVPEGQKLVMCAFIKIQHHNVTDGQQKWYRARLTRDQGVSHAASTVIDGQAYMLGRSLFLLKNRILARVLPNLNRSG